MKKILTTIFLLTSIIFFSQEMNNDSIIETKINELARQVSSVDNNLIGQVEKLKEILNSIDAFQDNIDRISSENKIFADSISDIITSVDYRLLRLDSLINILHKDLDSNKIDNNDDGITDLTLQDRISIFNKWSFDRKKNRLFTIAGRYMYEDRWGGELDWTPEFRGGDSIYGESIYTSRWEAFGVYELPTKEKVNFSFSANGHDQNSVYGDTWYIANQSVFFGQLTWFKKIKKHDFTTGLAYRYTYYDDNSIATVDPGQIHLPGVFVQDQISLSKLSTLLLGGRYDYNSNHGNVFSPRANYKWRSKNKKNTLRLST